MSLPTRHVLGGSDEVRRQSLTTQAGLLEQRLGGEVWPGAMLPALSAMAYDTATIRAALDPHDPAILADLARCACAAAGAFLAAVLPGTEAVEGPGPGQRRVQIDRARFDRRKLKGQVHWRTGMLAAGAARHHEAIATLASIQPDDLQGLSPAAPPWIASEAAALTALFLRDGDAAARLVTAVRDADPERVDPISRNYVLDVVTAELELGFRIVDKDAAGVERALRQALDGHHHYYGQGDARGLVEGQLALAPLAMACLAADLGITTTVTSDYIPGWIVARRAAAG